MNNVKILMIAAMLTLINHLAFCQDVIKMSDAPDIIGEVTNADRDYLYFSIDSVYRKLPFALIISIDIKNTGKRNELSLKSKALSQKLTGAGTQSGSYTLKPIPEKAKVINDVDALPDWVTNPRGNLGGKKRYAELWVKERDNDLGFLAYVDSGQFVYKKYKYNGTGTASPILFNSVVDAINFMNSKGYEWVATYPMKKKRKQFYKRGRSYRVLMSKTY